MSISTIQGNSSNPYQPLENVKRKEDERLFRTGEQRQQSVPQGRDEYLPEEPVGSPVEGIYGLGYDEAGNPTVSYIAPRASEAAPASESKPAAVHVDEAVSASDVKEADSGDKSAGNDRTVPARTSSTTTNTDRVDNEIKRLKEQRQLLQQRIRAESDEGRKAELQSQLQQIASQLSQKDNDFYRKQNAVVL